MGGSNDDGTQVVLQAGDGHPVVAHRFEAPDPHGAVVVAAALGVPQRFYRDFAAWLATQGWTAFTFDYRGVGHGAPRSMRGFRASLDDWAARDFERVVAEAARVAGTGPLCVVGHSLGAQLVPLLPSAGRVRALVAIAGGMGYWRGLDPALRPFMLALLHGVAPLAMPLAGYFPGRRLRMLGDLPAGVMRQWRRWCLHADYLVGVEPGARDAYARARFDLLSITFADDRMMPLRNVDALHAHLRGVRRETLRLGPAEAGGPVGHLGFFRSRYRQTLWPRAGDWLAQR